ncbi:MAG TPA: aminomethyl-transferring glycine dehydrogenase subunit GcvPA [Chloroflexota bacterium]|nr:aminomethyl-transferring glycine dehydrogenase subunit GcvPA [Chloroflexota bacterium]
MDYLSHTEEERRRMLDSIGASSVEDLFLDVPKELRVSGLDIGPGLSEPEVLRLMTSLAAQNENLETRPSFLGGGAYYGYVPAAVGAITGRAEFYTSYTPYQAELSQGTLQVIYEFQSMIAELTGLDVANASLYDGATAVAEACGMALNATGRDRVAILDSVNPEYRRVLETYATGIGYEIDEIPSVPRLSLDTAQDLVGQEHAALVVQNPDFLGSVAPMEELSAIAHASGALFIAVVDPVSLGLLMSPGEYGADIAVGEGQNLGGWLSYGGPYLGFMATTSRLQRRIPGRIAGATVDAEGRRAFVLTLQTREQHIRRERATSNICTNEALVALGATVYLALVGNQGLARVAELGLRKAHYAASRLSQLAGFEIVSPEPFFREFVLSTPVSPDEVNRFLLGRNILGGIAVDQHYPGRSTLDRGLLLSFTEQTTRRQIDDLVDSLAELQTEAATPEPAMAGGSA